MKQLYESAAEAAAFIRTKSALQPRLGIVLGTGLSALADRMDVDATIPYASIPYFPQSTVQSHKGQVFMGRLSNIPLIAFAGRFHYYEGYSAERLTFPIRVLKLLGIDKLILSNVAGGLNPHYEAGDIVCINDHINLQAGNPLRGPNDARFGPRFPDMTAAYDPTWIRAVRRIGAERDFRIHAGVYACLQGPNLESPAEYRFLRRIGADLVGMSTVPEVLVARHMSMRVLALSIVSNICFPTERIRETTIESVIRTAEEARPKLEDVVRLFIQQNF